MKKFICTCFVLVFYHCNIYALTLNEALVLAYDHDILKAHQAEFLSEIEMFPTMLSEFLPHISAEFNVKSVKSTTVGKYGGTPGQNRKEYDRGLRFYQPIFNGGASVAGLTAAKYNFVASVGKLYSAEQEFMQKAITAYIDYYQANEQFKVSEKNVDFYVSYVKSLEEIVKVGNATKTDEADAKRELAKSKFEKSKRFADLQTAKAEFIHIFGIEPSKQLTKIKINDKTLPKTSEEVMYFASISNPTLDYLKYSVKANKAGTMRAAGGLLPTVSLTAQTNRSYHDPEGAGILGGYHNSRDVTTMLNIHVPIFDKGGVEYSNIRKSKKQAKQNMHKFEDYKQQLYAKAVSALESVAASKERVQYGNIAIQAAELSLERTKSELKHGTKTNMHLLEAKTKLYNIKVEYLASQAEYWKSVFALKGIMGHLTAKNLKLDVKLFNPEKEFRDIKFKIMGSR